ncbi:tape measure protein, partial [Chitinimonas sp.]|uniref:tape measure protein n=1 Tax=Chitinimonas sp. TaxID=1934313 RepID=UPI0035B41DA0
MSGNDITVGIRLKADGSGFVGEMKLATGALDQLGAASKKTASEGEKFIESLRDQVSAIGKTKSEMLMLRASKLGVADAATELIAKLRAEEAAQARLIPVAGRAGEALNGLATGMQALQAAGAAVAGSAVVATLAGMGKSALDAQIQIDKLRTGLKFANDGSTVAAGKDLEYLKETANRLGMEFTSTANSYMKLAAAAHGTSLQGQKTRDIFEAIGMASTTMHLSAEESSGALLAISQMMSKGTVQSEELRGQLSERLPGAFQMAARAMGVSTAELGKMLEQGEVISDDFLPKFAAQMRREMGDASAEAAGMAQAAVNRLHNAWVELQQRSAEGGAGELAVEYVKGLTAAVETFGTGARRAKEEGAGAFSQLAHGVLEVQSVLIDANRGWLEYIPVVGKGTIAVNDYTMASREQADQLRRTAAAAEKAKYTAAEAYDDIQRLLNRAGKSNYKSPVTQAAEEEAAKWAKAHRSKKQMMDDDIAQQKRWLDVGAITQQTYAKNLDLIAAKYSDHGKAAKAAGKENEALADILNRLNGVNVRFNNDLDALKAGLKAGKMTTAEYAEAVRKLVETETDAGKATVAYAKKLEETKAAHRAQVDGLKQEIDLIGKTSQERELASAQLKIETDLNRELTDEKGRKRTQKEIDDLKEEARVHGLVVDALMRRKLALQGANELEVANRRFAADSIIEEEKRARALLEIEADTWRKRIDLAAEGSEERKRLEGDFQQWYANQQAKPANDMAKTIYNKLIDGAARGWKGFRDLGSQAFDWLKHQVIRIALQPVLTSVAGTLGSIGAGIAGSSAAASTGAAGASGLSALGSLGGIGGGVASLGSSIGFAGLESFGYGLQYGMTGVAQTYGAFGSVGAGQVLGAAMPWIAAAAALYAIVSSVTKGETRQGGQYGYGTTPNGNYSTSSTQFIQGPSGGQIAGDSVTRAVDGTISGINQALAHYGSTAKVTGFQAGLESSDRGRGGVYAGGTLSTGATFGDLGLGGGRSNYHGTLYDPSKATSLDSKAALEAFSLDLKQATVQALQAADLPGEVGKYLKSVGDVSHFDQAAIDNVLQTAETIKQTIDLFTQLGQTFGQFAGLSYEAEKGLVDLFGGLDKFNAGLNAYVSGFYTEAERTAQSTAALNKAFTDLGVQMPQNEADFKKLVESQKLENESDRKRYATLIALAPAERAYLDSLKKQKQQMAETATTLGLGFDTIKSGILQAASNPDAKQAGDDFSAALVGSVNNALLDSAASQLASIFTEGIVDPIVKSVMAGTTITDAISEASIDAMVKKAQDTAAVFEALFNDKGFQDLLAKVGKAASMIGGVASTNFSRWPTKNSGTGSGSGDAGGSGSGDQKKDAKDYIKDLNRQLEDLNAADDYARQLKQINRAYQDGIDGLSEYTGDVETARKKLGELKQAQLAQLEAQRAEKVSQIIDGIGQSIDRFGLSPLAGQLYDIDQQYQQQYKSLQALNAATGKNIELLDQWRQMQIAAAQFDDTLEKLKQSFANLQTVRGFMSAIDAGMAKVQIDTGELDQADYLNQQISQAKRNLSDLYQAGAGTDELSNAAKALFDLDMQRYDAQKQAADKAGQAAQKQLDFARQLRDYLTSLTYSDLSPLSMEAKLAAAQADYRKTRAAAAAGDTVAQGKLQSVTEAALKLTQDYHASGKGYTDFYNEVQQSGNALVTDLQTDAQRQTSELRGLNASAKATLDELRGLKQATATYEAQIKAQVDAQVQKGIEQYEALKNLGGSMDTVNTSILGLPSALAKEIAQAWGNRPPQPTAAPSAPTTTSGPRLDVGLLGRAESGDLIGAIKQGGAQGYSASELAQMWNTAHPASPTSAADVASFARANKIPGFDVGTNRVPSDMLALVHQGERIIPAADNARLEARLAAPMVVDWSQYGRESSTALVAEVKALREINTRLETRLAAIEKHTREANKQRADIADETLTEQAATSLALKR